MRSAVGDSSRSSSGEHQEPAHRVRIAELKSEGWSSVVRAFGVTLSGLVSGGCAIVHQQRGQWFRPNARPLFMTSEPAAREMCPRSRSKPGSRVIPGTPAQSTQLRSRIVPLPQDQATLRWDPSRMPSRPAARFSRKGFTLIQTPASSGSPDIKIERCGIRRQEQIRARRGEPCRGGRAPRIRVAGIADTVLQRASCSIEGFASGCGSPGYCRPARCASGPNQRPLGVAPAPEYRPRAGACARRTRIQVASRRLQVGALHTHQST